MWLLETEIGIDYLTKVQEQIHERLELGCWPLTILDYRKEVDVLGKIWEIEVDYPDMEVEIENHKSETIVGPAVAIDYLDQHSVLIEGLVAVEVDAVCWDIVDEEC